MAKKVITLLTDDLDGGEADQTVAFAFDGNNYTIDLSEKNAKEFRAVMERFTAAGTRTGRYVPTSGAYTPGSTIRRGARTLSSRGENSTIRTWAIDNGYDLAERGRIPGSIIEAYRSGTPNPARTVTVEPEPAPEPVAEEPAAPRKRTARKPAETTTA